MAEMSQVDVRELITLRDAFAELYRKPAGRFVSLGFAQKGGKPCLRVLVDQRHSVAGLPHTFHGMAVDVRKSPPAMLAIGPAI